MCEEYDVGGTYGLTCREFKIRLRNKFSIPLGSDSLNCIYSFGRTDSTDDGNQSAIDGPPETESVDHVGRSWKVLTKDFLP